MLLQFENLYYCNFSVQWDDVPGILGTCMDIQSHSWEKETVTRDNLKAKRDMRTKNSLGNKMIHVFKGEFKKTEFESMRQEVT